MENFPVKLITLVSLLCRLQGLSDRLSLSDNLVRAKRGHFDLLN